jgi:alcohol dehydrogenase (cytochrome c)
LLGALSALAMSAFGIAAEPQQVGVTPAALAQCQQGLRQMGASPAEAAAFLRNTRPDDLAEKVAGCLRDIQDWIPYQRGPVNPAAVERGHGIYTTYGCAFCHGEDTRGGEGGPSLLRSQRVLHDTTGEQIGEVILKGVPGTAMAAFPLKPNEVADVAEFLHSFEVNGFDPARRRPQSIVTGDAGAGRRYFASTCAGCHSTAGDLKGMSVKYPDPQVLQQTWLMPKAVLPVTATVTASDGAVAEGRLQRMDEFVVTLVLPDGTQRTFERRDSDEPKLEIHEPLARHRALLASYTDRNIHDLTAYLVSLKQARTHADLPLAMTASGNKGVASSGAIGTSSVVAGLRPEDIRHPSPNLWPTYSGDYSGRRYSAIKEIDQTNVARLALAWTTRLTAGPNDKGSYPLIIGGEGNGDLLTSMAANVRASILEVGGVLYLSTPDNAWAVDARDGHVRWHYHWKTRGGTHLSNRGLGMWGNYLYLETPDAYLVSLDASSGKERWHVQIASFEEQYYATPAPIVADDHVLVGIGANLDSPGFLQSYDPDTGKLQWKLYSVPMNPGDPGLETWKNLDAARHGGGATWVPGVYDTETHLYIYSTGNPTPAYFADTRGNGDALFTCSMIAVDVATGKMAWHYQTSPNDTHDWDSAQTPILAEIAINGKQRKVVMTAARNGYFFVVDRTTGAHLLTGKFSNAANWAEASLNSRSQPIRIPEKDSDIAGALVSNANEGAANWQPASYSPDYELFYVPAAESWAMYYRTETDPRGAMGLGGKEELPLAADSYLKAIDPKTGKIIWSIKYPSGGDLANGILTTAGRLLFSGDTNGNLVARDPANGKPLWHTHLGRVSNAPETYLLDGHQYILVAAGDTLYSFWLYPGTR